MVIEGLRPACLEDSEQDHEVKALQKSQRLWNLVKDNKAKNVSEADMNSSVFQALLKEYGSRFYLQELINATKMARNCTYFVAPFTQTAQLA